MKYLGTDFSAKIETFETNPNQQTKLGITMTLAIHNHTTESLCWQQWHINRPDRLNAIGTTLAGELTEALQFFRQNPPDHCRALVITATPVQKSDRTIWIAGGDLTELATLTRKSEGRQYATIMRSFCEGLERLPIPVITVVDGAAIGGGAELALSGDIRLATVRSSFEFKQLKIGLTTGYGASSRLISLLGKSRAQSLLYFCETIDAETAHENLLIHRLIPSSSTDDIGKSILNILQLEPSAVRAQKEMLRLASDSSGADHTWADDLFESIWMNETHTRNLSAWNKR
jgi:enoyl-CoA hydratase/carnithine racemase